MGIRQFMKRKSLSDCRNAEKISDERLRLEVQPEQTNERERERESLLAQTLNNFIQIKAKPLGHRKKPVKQFVSSGAPRQFHKFLSWFKVDGRIIANLIRLLF